MNQEQSPPFRGEATWIWSQERLGAAGEGRPYRVRYFRRAFAAEACWRLVVHVSADSRYKLWCNGRLVSRGPAKGDVRHQFYDTVDVSAMLRSGANVLAAQVEYYGDSWPQYSQGGPSVSQMTACPGFVLSGQLRDDSGGLAEELHTGAAWRVAVDEAWRHVGCGWYAPCAPMSEVFDCARHPWGFAEAGFDDSSWPPAAAIAPAIRLKDDRDSFMPHRMVGRMIEPLEESAPRGFARAFRAEGRATLEVWQAMIEGRGQAVVAPGQSAVVRLDAGSLATGYPRLRLRGPGQVTLTYAEALTDADRRKSNRNDLAFGEVRGQHDTVLADGPERTYEPFFWRTFRFVEVAVRAGSEPLTVLGLDYAFTAYPLAELGAFQSSDPALAAVWDLCWRTQRLCAHETFEDCPYFEQLQYGGDSQVQAMVCYYVAGESALARQFLYHFDWSRDHTGLTASRYPSRVPQVIPFWSLHWVLAARDYWWHTGNRQTVRDLMPGVRAVMDYFHRRLVGDGTVGRLDGWLVADWSPQWLPPLTPKGVPPGCQEGQGALASLMVSACLPAAAELAQAAGGDGADLLGQAKALKAAAHRKYYDTARGLYRDRPDADGASAYTNVWAVLAGMPCDARALAERIVGDRSLCELTTFSAHFAWRALAAAGRYDLAAALLAPWRQMSQAGLTTCPETIHLSAARSDCHAWAAGPLVELLREVLGVRPDRPGYAAVAIEPKPLGLSFARGQVPLPAPDSGRPARVVKVDWRIDGGRFLFAADSPPGLPCRVLLPGGEQQVFPDGGRIEMTGVGG